MNKIKVSVIIPVYNDETLIYKALQSVPTRNDIELIVIDDGSTDDTWKKIMAFREKYSEWLNLVVLYNEENKGVAYTINRGYDIANGEYIVLLGSDDYFYKDNFIKAIDELDGTDFVFFDTINNYGIVELNEHNKCGSFKFMRKEFIKDFRNDEFRLAGEDYHLWKKMLEKNPTIKKIDLMVKYYNYPREGSLNWQINNGYIDLESGLKNDNSNMLH